MTARSGRHRGGWLKWALEVLGGAVVASCVAAAVLCENALHIPAAFRRQNPPRWAQAVADQAGGTWQTVETTAADGVILRGWLFRSRQPNGDFVILLHGVADSRSGTLPQAALFLRHGYSVLAPDSRGHGASGGDVITYGIREVGDLRRWEQWLLATEHPRSLYGLGESMGGAILLQSVAGDTAFRSVIAECPFATFHEVAYDRLSGVLGIPRLFGRGLLWGVVEPAFFYARMRYGIDLRKASPLGAVRGSRVPILLIHGTADTNIPPDHSRELAAANPGLVRLWEVPNAHHVSAVSEAPEEFERRVIEWFQAPPALPVR
jgi:alpha-beta hydrolase superfamily lysophospholipase